MMKLRRNIWTLYDEGTDIVVTTNIGWDPDTMRNNMGAGTVLEAMLRYRELPVWYGRECKRMAETDTVDVLYRPDLRLYFLPVKPLLDPSDPEMSWNQNGDYELIDRMLGRLAAMARPNRVALTLPGCGNGGLDRLRMLGIVERHLGPAVDVVLCDQALPKKRAA